MTAPSERPTRTYGAALAVLIVCVCLTAPAWSGDVPATPPGVPGPGRTAGFYDPATGKFTPLPGTAYHNYLSGTLKVSLGWAFEAGISDNDTVFCGFTAHYDYYVEPGHLLTSPQALTKSDNFAVKGVPHEEDIAFEFDTHGYPGYFHVDIACQVTDDNGHYHGYDHPGPLRHLTDGDNSDFQLIIL
jgi:hypothetical protein